MVVSLASIIVVNLTYSTLLGSRLSVTVERNLQAEYLLKSAVNFARVLLKEDNTSEASQKDLWAPFASGLPLDPSLLGINSQNMRIELEIRPEESKIPLKELVPSGSDKPDQRWRDTLVRLFQSLGFDDDEEEDQSGIFRGRHFTSQELVANLIDYMDPNKESYEDGNFARGIEGEGSFPEGLFPNDRIQRLGELAQIPGFTAGRIRKLTPFCTVFGTGRLNVNLAPLKVITALEGMDESLAQQLVDFRNSEEGPFTSHNLGSKLSELLGDDIYQRMSVLVGVDSRWFQVVAKVDYQTSTYFMRAYLQLAEQGSYPRINSIELF